ncbi:MAG: RNA polymerase-binding protein DksA [Hydrogenophaga sp.]|nr:RNA polymerase-binding protein DksA [Hydrogenophaga sp.]
MKAAAKPTAKAATKAKPGTTAKTVVAKVAAKAVVKPAAKAAAQKPAPKAAAKVATKAAPKAATKAAVKVAPKAAAAKKTPAPPATKAAAPKPVAKPAPVKAPAAKAAPAKSTPVKAAPAAAPAKAAAPSTAAAPKRTAAPAEATMRPGQEIAVLAVGKRAAKKAMMAQMAQAVSLPTHDPDAAKATFSISNERAMNTPVHTPVRKDPKLANNWKAKPVDQLSDDEVLSMPDSEYMNDVQLAFFRLKLSKLKADMLANAGETTEHLREDTVVVPDPADRATIEEEHALELRTRDRERKLLKKIEQAIVRIDAGDYGYCDETGEAIGVGRLLARPTASLSLEAQQRRELKQKMFGD